MKHSTFIKLTAGIAVAACSLLAPADSLASVVEKQIKWGRHRTGMFDSPRMRQIQAANDVLDGKARRVGGLTRWDPATAETANPKPSFEFKDQDYFGDLDGPDGKLWYYTAHFDYKRIEPHDNVEYVDFIMQRYHFNIYDAEMKFVGTVSDTVTYAENEVRVRQADLAPVVTRHFFNTDDKYEIIVGLVVNTTYYVNRNYTKIYSLDGEKTDKGFDVCCQTFNEPVCDVLDASTPEKEHVYISFMSEGSDYEFKSEEDREDFELNYWEKLISNYTEVKTYAPAVDDKGIQLVNTYKVNLVQMPGDMQYTPIIMSFMRDGVPYFVTQYYEQYFYNRYDSYDDPNSTQREDNNLIIDIYKVADTGFEKVQSTKVPAALNTENDKVVFSFYSIGMLSYYGDVISNGDAFDFIVDHQDYLNTSDNYQDNFYRHNSKGEKTNTVFEGADSYMGLSDLPGHAQQIMFVGYNTYGEYEYNFVNMDTYETVLKQNYLKEMEDGDPERLTANMDRMAVGDSYMYAVELRVPSVDADDNNNLRVMWLDKDGNFDHIEEVNIGQNVNYATVFLSAYTLDPHYFNSDENREYMVLIKRAIEGGGSQEELLIGQAITADMPKAKDLLLLGPDKTDGSLAGIVPYEDRLLVSYKKSVKDQDLLTARYYLLPLDKHDGINSVDAATEGNGIQLVGDAIVAEGRIKVYSLTGACVAGAEGSLPLEGLRQGIYVVRAGGKSAKIVVR